MSERIDYGKPGDPSGCYLPKEWRARPTPPLDDRTAGYEGEAVVHPNPVPNLKEQGT